MNNLPEEFEFISEDFDLGVIRYYVVSCIPVKGSAAVANSIPLIVSLTSFCITILVLVLSQYQKRLLKPKKGEVNLLHLPLIMGCTLLFTGF